VLVDVPDGAECSREEIFGPVVTVETLTDEDEALTRANGTPYGLAASVWTADARRSHDVAWVWLLCSEHGGGILRPWRHLPLRGPAPGRGWRQPGTGTM
jgi:aminobutyraldehyde dehydrogenase